MCCIKMYHHLTQPWCHLLLRCCSEFVATFCVWRMHYEISVMGYGSLLLTMNIAKPKLFLFASPGIWDSGTSKLSQWGNAFLKVRHQRTTELGQPGIQAGEGGAFCVQLWQFLSRAGSLAVIPHASSSLISDCFLDMLRVPFFSWCCEPSAML